MHIEDTAQSRRVIRDYDSSFSLTREEKDHLLDLALRASSTLNLQHVRSVEVSGPQLHTQLRETTWDQARVTDATMLVVACAQLDGWKRNAQRIQDGTPEVVQAFMADAIDTYYRGKSQVQHDEVMCGYSLLAQVLMPVACGQSLDPCPMDDPDSDAVARLISLPNNHVIDLIVAVEKKAIEP